MAFWKNAKAESRQDPLPPENVPASEEESPKDNHLSFDEIFGAIQENLQQGQKPYTLPEQPEAETVPEEPIAPHLPRQVNRKRDCKVTVRFSDSEIMLLKKRVARSGMSLSWYIRHVALEGKLPVPDRDETGKALSRFSRELDDLIAELGRQGGMLKLGMKPNQERKTQDPEGWSDIVLLIRFLERYVRIFKEKLEQMGKGKHDAARLQKLAADLEEVGIAVHAQGIGLRNVIQPELGQRPFPQEQWGCLCALSRNALSLYQNIVSKTLEEINGYYQTLVL